MFVVAGATRLELATSGVTGRRSNQLNYDPTFQRRRIIAHNCGLIQGGLIEKSIIFIKTCIFIPLPVYARTKRDGI